ncbi:hypothetical protein TTHERM_00354950 (macronuclear) [Tetrahymena thermophila SB210]|uniref:Uncharacterized protein n=1 Tax=Tetrahymena thermophila (strain SB210) TaxID=312017 RepID=Q22Y76_TETTS|nr:hypothetical protein TTHERM_00354950 [Tetrahymena thermophila SB210]EAR90148.1 hypothetical protein TTHERM_00354950 [Tetrahymena thermophila SB210]|eukprot:XP_001010393.1 hypothetical protein TTHERM_00354950 [Tetrahymena thermophila SB210]
MEDNQADQANKTLKKQERLKKMKDKLAKNDQQFYMPIEEYVLKNPPFDSSQNMNGKWLQSPYEFGTQYYRLDGAKVFIFPESKIFQEPLYESCSNDSFDSDFESTPPSPANQSKDQSAIKLKANQCEQNINQEAEEEVICENEIGFLFDQDENYIDVQNYEILLTKEYEYFIFRPKESLLNILNEQINNI